MGSWMLEKEDPKGINASGLEVTCPEKTRLRGCRRGSLRMTKPI